MKKLIHCSCFYLFICLPIYIWHWVDCYWIRVVAISVAVALMTVLTNPSDFEHPDSCDQHDLAKIW